MNMFLKVKWLPIVAFFLIIPLTLARAELKVGDAAPDVTKFKLEGTVPETKGKVVLLDFWGSWCGPCAQSFPVMEELHKRYADKGLVIIAVSADEKFSAMQSFLKKHPVTFPVVRDMDQKLVAAADVQTMPTSFLIDAEGKVRFVHNGFHPEETKKQYVTEIETLLKSKP